MNRSRIVRLALAASLLWSTASVAAADKVLLVVSSHGRVSTEKPAGFDMAEYAQAYWLFRDHGYEVQVASPSGGEAIPDRYEAEAPPTARLLAAPEAMTQLRNTRQPEQLNPADYAAVLVIGGKGAMFDLPGADPLHKLLARHYQGGGVLGTVCHGAAALLGVKQADGRPLIAGRAVNSFSREEERLFNPDWSKRYPFVLEDRLREQGARFEAAPPMLIHVTRDERLFSGQNPFSTAPLVEAMLRALGREPKPRQIGSDELTLRLLGRLLVPAQRPEAERELAAEPNRFQPRLIALYGTRLAKGANGSAELETALHLMTLAAPYFSHPRLDLARAETLRKLGRSEAARQLLEQASGRHPSAPELKQALAELETASR
ncbi:type 1 glutamine amidotransferase domain-containing protein [Chitinimonas lacunae]|uniref:Type 1 glutamine amidotransferase domain-containing protein n=1 Tax=Chitinimonas lacunae TaxID=1963018 RepID=A0ABV8MNJ4_9NEIS